VSSPLAERKFDAVYAVKSTIHPLMINIYIFIYSRALCPSNRADEVLDTLIPAVNPSKKGVNIGAKWEFTDAEISRLLDVLPHLRDRVMLRLGCYLGYRISELTGCEFYRLA
jgi:hypothetical protein